MMLVAALETTAIKHVPYVWHLLQTIQQHTTARLHVHSAADVSEHWLPSRGLLTSALLGLQA